MCVRVRVCVFYTYRDDSKSKQDKKPGKQEPGQKLCACACQCGCDILDRKDKMMNGCDILLIERMADIDRKNSDMLDRMNGCDMLLIETMAVMCLIE